MHDLSDMKKNASSKQIELAGTIFDEIVRSLSKDKTFDWSLRPGTRKTGGKSILSRGNPEETTC